jgi:membrane protease YdiL (CAAX protease family)
MVQEMTDVPFQVFPPQLPESFGPIEAPVVPRKWPALAESAIGFALITAAVWSPRAEQRILWWISAAWFLCFAAVGYWRSRANLRFPSLKISVLIIAGGILIAAGLSVSAAAMGTLHGLFGVRNPIRHATSYLLWATIQQWIQQRFFLHRFEQLTTNGLLASFITASLFAVVHLPNPVLVPVTFLGGWIMSELYRRYRCLLALGIAHGTVGVAIAVSVPDSIQHHMRVGLGYLTYPH